MKAGQKTILWVDNDDPERYLYERWALEELGWKIVWARSLGDAVKRLAREAFAAVLLDQVFPHEDEPQSEDDVWAGCRLLYWLKEAIQPASAPPPEPAILASRRPHRGNRSIPVCLVTAFFEPEIEKALGHHLDGEHLIVRKPIPFDDLRRFLDEVEQARETAA